jgi:putative SOS response-associated peptidase YedK
MCNLYSHTRNVEAMRKLFAAFDVMAQVVPQPGIFPDYEAPIIRNESEGPPRLTMTRWGMPSSKQALYQATSQSISTNC